MDPLRPQSQPPPDPFAGGGRTPFTMRFQNVPPVLGCLFAVGALVIGGLLALGAGIVVLLAPLGLLAWRLLKQFLPAPAEEPVATRHESPEIIDVESTLLPPKGERDGD